MKSMGWIVGVLLVAIGCGSSEHAGPGDLGSGADDTGSGLDADTDIVDMATPSGDVGRSDAGTVRDASVSDQGGADAGDIVACSTGSRDGVCLPTADCGSGSESVPGFCPGPTDIQCCVPVDDATCRENPPVEEMPQPNAGLVEAPGQGGCPDGMTAVTTFCVDRFEAALVEVLNDGSERPWSPYFNPGDRRTRAVSIEAAVPQAYINGLQAADACAEAGKRLCTDAEWLRACQGPAGTTYPYGDTRQPGVCNDARDTHPAIEYFGSDDPSVFSMLDNACIGQQEDTVDRAGTNAGCVSVDGGFDMMGNLHEWTADPNGTFRGGFYVDTFRNGDGCLYATTAHTRSHWDYSTGFRCCADLP